MPKTRHAKVRGGSTHKADALTFKFKLGGRKSSTSALALSSDELLKRFFTLKKGKDRQKIQQVLQARKVEIKESLETENEDQ